MDISIRVPFWETSPYLALHIKHWGWQLGPRPRQLFVVMLMWGRFFVSPKWGGYRSWELALPIKTYILK